MVFSKGSFYITLSLIFLFLFYPTGSQAALVDNGDGTITDRSTGLMWQKSQGASVHWDDAVAYCQNLNLGGHSDWRMPSIEELRTLHDPSFSYPQINTSFFLGTNISPFWSSCESQENYVWVFNFWRGVEQTAMKTFPNLVRAVRTVPAQVDPSPSPTPAPSPSYSLSGIWGSSFDGYQNMFTVHENNGSFIAFGIDLGAWHRPYSWEVWAGEHSGNIVTLKTLEGLSLVDAKVRIELTSENNASVYVESCHPRLQDSWCVIESGSTYNIERLF